MEDYVPGIVYQNIIKMMGYRGLKLKTEVLDVDKLVNKLNVYGFVALEATAVTAARPMMVFLFSPDSKYTSKLPEFKKIFKFVPSDSDVLFVFDSPMTSHISKYIDGHALTANIETCTYNLFIVEMPLVNISCKHSIASAEEVEKYCEEYYTSKNNFPKILRADPQAMWIGAKKGQVVRLDRPSENAGHAVAYRLVI